jgi:hypothetical protein
MFMARGIEDEEEGSGLRLSKGVFQGRGFSLNPRFRPTIRMSLTTSQGLKGPPGVTEFVSIQDNSLKRPHSTKL